MNGYWEVAFEALICILANPRALLLHVLVDGLALPVGQYVKGVRLATLLNDNLAVFYFTDLDI